MMSNSDHLPDYPLHSDLVRRLKSALDAKDEERVSHLICTEVGHVDAIIELDNDDWMKDPAAQLPVGALVGNQRVSDTKFPIMRGELFLEWKGDGGERLMLEACPSGSCLYMYTLGCMHRVCCYATPGTCYKQFKQRTKHSWGPRPPTHLFPFLHFFCMCRFTPSLIAMSRM